MLPVVILSGGLATRMYPYTKTVPKALLSVNGRPFVDYQLSLLAKKGIQKVIFCVGYLAEQLMEYVGNGQRYGLKVDWSIDGPQLLGTGGAIRHALPLLGKQFMVLYGDSYLDIEYTSVVEAFCKSSTPALMTIYKNDNKYDTSNVQFCDGQIINYNKRDRTELMNYIDYGLGCFNSNIFLKWEDTIFDLEEVYTFLVKHQKLSGYEVTQRFYEIGSPSGLKELEGYLLKEVKKVIITG